MCSGARQLFGQLWESGGESQVSRSQKLSPAMSDPGSLLRLSIMMELVGKIGTVGRWEQNGQNPNDSLAIFIFILELQN